MSGSETKEPAAEQIRENANTNGNGKRKRAVIILIVLIAAGVAMGCKWWVDGHRRISTDNAFVESHVHYVSSRVPGSIARVHVKDNQYVNEGDLMLELDPADYAARAKQAESGLALARNESSVDRAQLDVALAEQTNAKAKLEQAQLDLSRGEALFAKEVISREYLDRLNTSQKVAAAQYREAGEKVRKAQATLGLAEKGGNEAKVALKEAQATESRLYLSYTRIYAPTSGYVTRKAVEPGNTIQPGQPLLALVKLEDAWVTANYKERQLNNVRPGQKVSLTVDAYPGRKFEGVVDSIMAGTGAAFSLLPPENATGNYVKVVQRIPVKIAIDRKSDPERLLRVGMSVIPTIHVERPLADIIKETLSF